MINASSELSLQAGTQCGGRWRVGWWTVWTGCFWRRFYTPVKPETGIKVNCPTSFCRRMYSTIAAALQHCPSLDLCSQKTRGISNFRPLHARIIKTGVEIKLFSENTLYYTLYTNAHTYEFIYFVLKRVCVVCVYSRVCRCMHNMHRATSRFKATKSRVSVNESNDENRESLHIKAPGSLSKEKVF